MLRRRRRVIPLLVRCSQLRRQSTVSRYRPLPRRRARGDTRYTSNDDTLTLGLARRRRDATGNAALRCHGTVAEPSTPPWQRDAQDDVCSTTGHDPRPQHGAAAARAVLDDDETPGADAYAAMVASRLRERDLTRAEALFGAAPAAARGLYLDTAMLDGYAKAGRVDRARELFDAMPARDDVSWLMMVSGYMRRKRFREAREIFDRAPSPPPTSVCNALLSGYAGHGYLKDAEELFGRMQRPDRVSWNAMITGYTRAGMMQVARRLFDEMPGKDTVSWTAIDHSGWVLIDWRC